AGAVDTFTSPTSYTRSLTDTAGATDAVTSSASSAVQVSLTDTAGATDTVAPVEVSFRAITDSAGATDVLTPARTVRLTLTDVVRVGGLDPGRDGGIAVPPHRHRGHHGRRPHGRHRRTAAGAVVPGLRGRSGDHVRSWVRGVGPGPGAGRDRDLGAVGQRHGG